MGALNLYNLPTSLMAAITASVIPAVSGALARRDRRGSAKITGSALRITALLAFPMGVGLFVMGQPIMRLLFTKLNPDLAGPLLSTLGLATVFVCMMLVCNSILQASGFVNLPIFIMIVGCAAKLIVNNFMVRQMGAVGAAVGTDGSLTVIKDLGLKEPYIGSIGLFSGEIADDIAMYFVESEQIPTACALGVLVDRDQSVLAAGGYLIQLLPGAEEGLIDKIEAGVRRVGSVSHALSRGLDAQGLLEEVLSDFQLEVLETHPVEYRCSCSRERVSRALISMGREELSSLIAEQGQADLSCQFCDKVYHFSKEELEGLLSSM